MKKITISVSALFLALGVLSGCGEKKEEAPKAEAPAAEQKPVEQAAQPAPAAEPAAPATAMDSMKDAAGSAAAAVGDVAGQAVDATKQAAGDAAQAVGDTAKAAGDAAGQAVDATKQAAGDAVDATKQAAGDAAQAVAGAAPDGEKVYRGLCFSCHDMAVAGAPKLGDKAEWAPRIATGNDALYKSAIEGRMNVTPGKVMPAKGGNPALSDAEVKAAVDWMVSQSK